MECLESKINLKTLLKGVYNSYFILYNNNINNSRNRYVLGTIEFVAIGYILICI
nr:MAG TPA: hypothetical protein [Caudoviricetes sp.]